ncbi:hypothetical protein HRD49_28015 [Corallococcus exiguus]|uniref:hypothetical protein n=1 Tax=Corallococcus exiguus TaxID=83462 RepID=UPI0015611938|nr:hypothetical protein [Corallococcus exiguus]NRD52341.1 hypothetical protein [Corallococcus exiguus]NRD65603.1 hypothetical protein [Corallococcus exiguus]
MRKSWPYAVVMLLVLVGVPRLLRHFIPDRRLALTIFPVVMFALLGRWAEARELLADAALENLNGPLLGMRNVLEVWCVEQLTGEARPVDAIALFGEASQDSLEAAWPELVNYVVKRSS